MQSERENSAMSKLSVLGGGEACCARWALGALLLAPLVAANSSYYAVPAILLLCAYVTLATFTGKDLKKLSELLPPARTARGRRERNLRCFAEFMVLWMTFLSHLVAVAICARILSATADHVTGGKTRRWLFGYETRALGEPWPDVLGVTVVMVVCAMFMCGLEESVMFTFMLLVVLYIFSQCFAIFGLINLDIENIKITTPISLYEIFTAGAPISYALCVVSPPNQNQSMQKNMIILILLPATILSTLCFLFTNMLNNSRTSIDAALPVFTVLEARTDGWAYPIYVVVTVIGICLALTELCPILFSILVALASPEWKVLTRSMTYESTTTGSPVLAVFTAGSLAAILAFACPLSHMITLMNASHLLIISIQAFYYIIMRCVPTAEQMEAGDVEYQRLGNEKTRAKSSEKKAKRGLWFIPSALRHTKTLESIKSKVTKETEDRECLLLDEYANCPTEDIDQVTSGSSGTKPLTLAQEEDVQSDLDVSEAEISSGDDSTDIDAVVKEYRDRIQVVTAIPVASLPTPPCVRGARWAAVGAVVQILADALIAVAFCNQNLRVPMLATGIPLWVCGTFISTWQPSHDIGLKRLQKMQGPVTLMISAMLLTPLLVSSWPAIILFAGAGVVIYARCERWCGDLAVQQARSTLEKRKLRHVASATPLTSARLTHIDTVYIAR